MSACGCPFEPEAAPLLEAIAEPEKTADSDKPKEEVVEIYKTPRQRRLAAEDKPSNVFENIGEAGMANEISLKNEPDPSFGDWVEVELKNIFDEAEKEENRALKKVANEVLRIIGEEVPSLPEEPSDPPPPPEKPLLPLKLPNGLVFNSGIKFFFNTDAKNIPAGLGSPCPDDYEPPFYASHYYKKVAKTIVITKEEMRSSPVEKEEIQATLVTIRSVPRIAFIPSIPPEFYPGPPCFQPVLPLHYVPFPPHFYYCF